MVAQLRRILLFGDRLRQSPMAIVGLVIILAIVAIGLLSQLFSPFDPFYQSDSLYAPPSREHVMGTDHLGRDVYARVLAGARVSTYFAVGAGGLSLIVGIVLGSIPGYFGGWLDDAFSRFFEFFLMIPTLFLIILIVSLFGGNLMLAMVIVGLTTWPSNAKIARAQVLTIKKRGFVDAARMMGLGHFRILFKHILPNGFYAVLANSTIQMAGAITTEASLSFLGLGDPNKVSWGRMIRDSLSNIPAWWLWVPPGLSIAVFVVALNVVADGIGFALNPRLPGKSAVRARRQHNAQSLSRSGGQRTDGS
jgi:peptide/nickel transport system permease protein